MLSRPGPLFGILTCLIALHVVQPVHAYDQAKWDELTKKETELLKTVKMRPLAVPAKGKTTPNLACYFDERYHYSVYLPKNYDPRREWPVVFINSLYGNGQMFCQMYQPYAEELGWIIAATTEAKACDDTAIENNVAMVKDVLVRFNVHKPMCIAAGFSTGARLSAMLAFAKQDFPWMMGAIEMGAGQGPYPPVAGKQIYLIIGTFDLNYKETLAWDKACREAGCQVEKVEWGAMHSLPSGEMFHTALKWQTETFLKSSADNSEATQLLRKEYVQKLIDAARTGDSGNKVLEIYCRYQAAYDAGMSMPCGKEMTRQAASLERRMIELSRYADVKKEIDCAAEIDKVMERAATAVALAADPAPPAPAAPAAPAADPVPAPPPVVVPAPAAPPEPPAQADPPPVLDAAPPATPPVALADPVPAPATPPTPAVPATPATPVVPAVPASPDAPATPAAPAVPPPAVVVTPTPPPAVTVPAQPATPAIPIPTTTLRPSHADTVIDDPLPAKPAGPATGNPTADADPNDDLLPEARKQQVAAVKEQQKQAVVQAKEVKAAAITVPDALRAIVKKYAGTPSAIRADLLARKWETDHPAAGAPAPKPQQMFVVPMQQNQAPLMPPLETPLLGPLTVPLAVSPVQLGQPSPAQPAQPGLPGLQQQAPVPAPAPAPAPAQIQPKPNGDRAF